MRLTLSVIAAALPLAAATVWARNDLTRRRVAQVLREFAVTRMESGGRERCERDPAAFPPPPPPPARDPLAPPLPPPPPELGPVRAPASRVAASDEIETRFWAYDAHLESANPESPIIAADLAAAARAGDDVAVRRIDGAGRRAGFEALVRMPWEAGPSAFVLVRRTGRGYAGDPLEALLPGLLVAAGVLVAVLLASGPVVRRIRRLEADVRRSAAAHYDATVRAAPGDDEVADLARAFDEAAAQVRAHVAQVERREGALRDFVANTTHDVMTPLTVLAGHLDALRPALDTADEGSRAALRDAVSEVDYTTSLVANLATAAKLDAGRAALVRHRVDLRALVDRVVSRHRPLASARRVELNHATPAESVEVDGDVTLLEQATCNIVQNAVRYNRPGGHVAVVLRSEGTRFELVVEDDGPGVAADDLPRLTERGYRGSAARTRTQSSWSGSSGASSSGLGRGLGLDITSEVCERLGFDLRFSATDEGGLAVTIAGASA